MAVNPGSEPGRARAGADGSPEDRPDVIARPPFLYLAALVLGIGLDLLWPATVGLEPSLLYSVAGALVAAGGALVALAARRFRAVGTNVPTNRPTTALVTDGPYRVSRNPIYIALSSFYVGLALFADSPWALALLAPLLVVMRYGVIAREEAYLARKFGAAYLGYKASVRRWL